jgi:hypothetical protein
MAVLEWNKPTISIYRERFEKQEDHPFAVIKAEKMSLEGDKEKGFKGRLEGFFSLMGDIDYISTHEGEKDLYVLCWFDDQINDFKQASRKLSGTTFLSNKSSILQDVKKSYTAEFIARSGKI